MNNDRDDNDSIWSDSDTDRFVSKRVSNARQTRIDLFLKRWADFCDAKGEYMVGKHETPLQNLLAEKRQWIKKFFFYLMENPGNGRQITKVLTLHNMLMDLSVIFQVYAGRKMLESTTAYLKDVICNVIPEKFPNLSKLRGEKSTLSVEDCMALWDFLWFKDDHQFQHPRSRVTFSATLKAATVTAARPVHFFGQSNLPASTRDSLKWKDFNFFLIRDPNFTERNDKTTLCMFTTFRINKGGDIDRPTAWKPLTIRFTAYKKNPMLCFVVEMLALGIADGIFIECKTVDSIRQLRIPSHRESLQLEINHDFYEIPVFRTNDVNPKGPGFITSPTRSIKKDTFERWVKDLGARAGFSQELIPYNIRRCAAAVYDKSLTEQQRNQVMRNTSQVFNIHYRSALVGPDLQSILFSDVSEEAALTRMKNLSMTRDTKAPRKIDPSTRQQLLTNSEKLKSLRNLQRTLVKSFIQRYGRRGFLKKAEKANDPELLHLKRLRTQYATERKRLVTVAFKKQRRDFFENNSRHELKSQSEGKLPEVLRSEDHVTMVELDPERSALAELFAANSESFSGENMKRWWETAIILSKISKTACFNRRLNHTGTPEPSELPVISTWCSRTQCIFCLGDESMKLYDRVYQFCEPTVMTKHTMKCHLERNRNLDDPISCPHPSCKHDPTARDLLLDDFFAHTRVVHNIYLRKKKVNGPRPPSEAKLSKIIGRLGYLPVDTKPAEIKTWCSTTQCIFCIGDQKLHHDSRVHEFAHPGAMRRHVQTQHMNLKSMDSNTKIPCPHPHCQGDSTLNDMALNDFYDHLRIIHNIYLNPSSKHKTPYRKPMWSSTTRTQNAEGKHAKEKKIENIHFLPTPTTLPKRRRKFKHRRSHIDGRSEDLEKPSGGVEEAGEHALLSDSKQTTSSGCISDMSDFGGVGTIRPESPFNSSTHTSTTPKTARQPRAPLAKLQTPQSSTRSIRVSPEILDCIHVQLLETQALTPQDPWNIVEDWRQGSDGAHEEVSSSELSEMSDCSSIDEYAETKCSSSDED